MEYSKPPMQRPTRCPFCSTSDVHVSSNNFTPTCSVVFCNWLRFINLAFNNKRILEGGFVEGGVCKIRSINVIRRPALAIKCDSCNDNTIGLMCHHAPVEPWMGRERICNTICVCVSLKLKYTKIVCLLVC